MEGTPQDVTIWHGTPAKYDMENFEFDFRLSWKDLHKNWYALTVCRDMVLILKKE